ncbi:Protein of unknown function DUF3661, vaculolar transmembrane [Phaffia rhodozyma]|uniref:Vacuolar membrane protein n=1 Tax=Phaffia rhodozyma TaxID=264483 RepID=A0A0F7SJM7_PHARH|nr:Protein of unknown function DUF3661, vaculolar transmembrane [Phaffia rhodozyma]
MAPPYIPSPIMSSSVSASSPSPSSALYSGTSSILSLPTENNNCHLLGQTGLIVQGLMGLGVLVTLVVKRYLEKPKRPWQIWTLDTSKQFIGQAIVHLSNILISTFPSPSPTAFDETVKSSFDRPNPCSLYFLNVLIDTTLGIFIIWVLLRLSRWILVDTLGGVGWEMGIYRLRDGDVRYSFWAKQCFVYVSCLLGMKGVVVIIFSIWPGIFGFGSWILSWLDPHGQVVFVMAIFPLIMNVVQFTIIDTILKYNESSSHHHHHHHHHPHRDSSPSGETGSSHPQGSGYTQIPTSSTPEDSIRSRSTASPPTIQSSTNGNANVHSGVGQATSGSLAGSTSIRTTAGMVSEGMNDLSGSDGGIRRRTSSLSEFDKVHSKLDGLADGDSDSENDSEDDDAEGGAEMERERKGLMLSFGSSK